MGNSDEVSNWLNDETRKTVKLLKEELMRRIEPVVNALVVKLRSMELKQPGLGIAQLDAMLLKGDVNLAMYEIIKPALEDLDTLFVFKVVQEEKAIKTKVRVKPKPTRLS